MAYEIYTYVSTLSADYNGTLSISPQRTLLETADKKQHIHEYDSGAIDVVTLSDTTFFNIALQWDVISESDAGQIMDFYADPVKANGRARTFYITLPDGYTYTVRFMGPLSRSSTPNLEAAGCRTMVQLILRVEGRHS